MLLPYLHLAKLVYPLHVLVDEVFCLVLGPMPMNQASVNSYEMQCKLGITVLYLSFVADELRHRVQCDLKIGIPESVAIGRVN